MTPREIWEVASRLGRLHEQSFEGKRGNRCLRLSHEQFYKIAGRQKLTNSVYLRIAAELFSRGQLILGRSDEGFVLVPAATARTWPEVAAAAVTKELKRKPPEQPAAKSAQGKGTAKTALSPAAAWPFPTGDKP